MIEPSDSTANEHDGRPLRCGIRLPQGEIRLATYLESGYPLCRESPKTCNARGYVSSVDRE